MIELGADDLEARWGLVPYVPAFVRGDCGAVLAMFDEEPWDRELRQRNARLKLRESVREAIVMLRAHEVLKGTKNEVWKPEPGPSQRESNLRTRRWP